MTLLSRLRCVIASARQPSPSAQDVAKEILKMIRPEIQTVVDQLNDMATNIPASVQRAVANAEALKDQDTADGNAALNTAVANVKSAVDAIASPAAQ